MQLRSAEQIAKLGIMLQFLILVRSLAEYFRLKYVRGGALTLEMAEPFLAGSLIAAVCTWVTVLFFFLGRHRTVIVLVAGTVVSLLIYKIYAVGNPW